jgi:23S rRNA (guanosine2251-2'-O)-methyltransferase
MLPERRNTPVTAAVRRAAAGAASHVRICRVTNLVSALQRLKSQGIWVIGATVSPNAVHYSDVDYRGKATVVIGAEHRGLSRLVSQNCDVLVTIPLAGAVRSLNAAAASAVILFEASRQRSGRNRLSDQQRTAVRTNP